MTGNANSGRKPGVSLQVKRALKELNKDIPALFKALVDRAKEGDREAAIYLIDRVIGKPKQQTDIDITSGGYGVNVLVDLLTELNKARTTLIVNQEPLKLEGMTDVQRQGEPEGSEQAGTNQT